MVTKEGFYDYLFRGSLTDVDPDVADLIRHETARQARYLIMVPSESTVPQVVRDTLASAFHNIYAEGYPLESNRQLREDEILDYNARLPEYRRYSDERYYKGTEYADIAESLARRRAAEVFATDDLKPEDLFVNVQPLSGAAANNAVYTALLNVGDTVLGMDLIQGGHLTHGSPVNRSGIYYNIISYGIDPGTGDIDYDEMRRLALEHKPKMIIGGYSSFPLAADWQKYREIADEVGAYLLADVAHVAGLIAGSAYPNPVGIADVVTFTTHKTLNGPRGAVIITHRKDLKGKIDRAVFPGEQGGPHVNQIMALAVALKLAMTEQFRTLQHQTVANAKRLSQKLTERGLKNPYGDTESHLTNIDLNGITGDDGTALSGDMAARILDLAGIVCNRQTIPGDTSPLRPNGIRLGTPWLTQRGFHEAEINQLADIIADLLNAAIPFSYSGRRRPLARAKVPFETLQDARLRVRGLAESAGIDTDVQADGYPHFHYIDSLPDDRPQTLRISGEKAGQFLHYALTSDVLKLAPEMAQPTLLLKPNGSLIAEGAVGMVDAKTYLLHLNRNAGYAATWLRSLSDGFVLLAKEPYAKLPGPVDVLVTGESEHQEIAQEDAYASHKPFFIGIDGDQYSGPHGDALPRFEWTEMEPDELLTTPLHTLHNEMGAKTVPFAGYDMPVWYTSVTEEHQAVRESAGVFDVAHMGTVDFKGPDAVAFLDTITTNDVMGLRVGSSHYTYLLDVDGVPFDDLLIYRLAEDHFFAVINAANNAKNQAWIRAVKAHEVMIDTQYPWRTTPDDFIMRDLRSPEAGDDRRVNIALQGPTSQDILLTLGGDEADQETIKKMAWADIVHVTLGEFDLLVSRTGYTGERVAYELFVHPDKAAALFKQLVEAGATPCGLASRDSLRIEAGLPLYGHELGGPLNLGPGDAGFGGFVKLWKPFFVGKLPHAEREARRDGVVTRFRLDNKGARPPHQGDPLVNDKGRVVGIVTSCSMDSDGYQLGQAYIKQDYTTEGTQLGVVAQSTRSRKSDDKAATLGKRITVPEDVTVLRRFPRRNKK